MEHIGQHAIVIGASMGGLVAARALTDYYQQVTLLERDTFPMPGENRKGVAQGPHAHALLAGGRAALENFFPGLTQELIEQGAIAGDISAQSLWFNHGGYHQRFNSGLQGLLVSRPTLEAQVRARVMALPNVRVIEQCDVLGLVTDADRSRVTGVRLLRRADGSAEEVLPSDLVIDASGRGSRSPAWLEALGYARPAEEQIRIGVGYTTRYYRRKPDHLPGGINAVVIAATPSNPRCGVLLAQEGDRWVVSIGGYLGDHAPTDEAGFLEFARRLPAPEIYELIKEAEPLTKSLTYKFPSSQRRHYEHLARFPAGYLVFGDAICSFNPIYGQGMTVAALEAATLHACLAQGDDHLAQRFFTQAGKLIDMPWSVAVGSDLRFPEVEGPHNGMVRFINWYMEKLHVAAHRDPVVSMAFLNVVNLLAAPPSVMRPAIALRVLWGNLWPVKMARSVKGDTVPSPSRG